MQRYTGQPFQPRRIAVVTNDALGNFVVATPLLQGLRAAHPSASLSYYGGERVQELASASDLVDLSVALHGSEPGEFARSLPQPYDWVINVERSPWAMAATAMLAGTGGWVTGPCLGAGGRGELPYPDDPTGDLWRDEEWISDALTRRHPILRSGWIAEIFFRAAYLEGQVPSYRVPSRPTDSGCDVLIAASASLPDKLWPLDAWRAVLAWARAEGLRVGLLGAKPSSQGKFWLGAREEELLVEEGLVEDLRGRYSLPEVVGALASCRAVLTLDNGILHLAAASGTPVVGLFRYGIHRLWCPPAEHLHALHPEPGRTVADLPVATVQAALADCLK